MSFGISATSSTLVDAWGPLPITFGHVPTTRRFGRLWFREDAPPWRYGWAVGIGAAGRFWFVGWSRRLTTVRDETDGSVRMMGGRELLNDGRDIGGWGSEQ